MELTRVILEALGAPFSADELDAKPTQVGGGTATALFYIDARSVMRRLDAVVGPANWSFDFDLLNPNGKLVRGKLTVLGVTKCDAGEGDKEDEPLKSAVSDALKRCGVHFGIGRYLYELPKKRFPYDAADRKWPQYPRPDPRAVERALGICGISTPRTAAAPESSGDQASTKARTRVTEAAQRAEREKSYGDATGAPAGQRAADVREQLPAKVQPHVTTAAELPLAQPPDGMNCSRPDCGKPLTKGQHDVSIRAFGTPLCPACQKQQARAGA